MPNVVETGTDVASVLIFDPLTLPHDFDRRMEDQMEILQELRVSGSVFLLETGADGAFLVYAFVDEPISDYLRPFLRDPIVLERFEVPSGRVYCAGLEYAFHSDDSRLKKYPHMGGHFTVQAGRCGLTMYSTEYPDEIMEEELKKSVAATAFMLHQSMGWFVWVAVLGFLLLVAAFSWLSICFWAVFPIALFFVALPMIVAKLPTYRKTDTVWREIQRKYPSLVAELHIQAKA